jgi:hypothetical protein
MKIFFLIHHTWTIHTPDSISTAREKLIKQIEQQKERTSQMRRKPFDYVIDKPLSLSGDVYESEFTVFQLVSGHVNYATKAHGKFERATEETIIHMSVDVNLAQIPLLIMLTPYYFLYSEGVKTLKNSYTVSENIASGIMLVFIGLIIIVIVNSFRQQCQSEIKFYKKELNHVFS